MSFEDHLDVIDPTFRDDLRNSVDAVWHVARWLSDHGRDVTLPALGVVRPMGGKSADYRDPGHDLVVHQKVDVKRRRFDFTGLEDYPFPTVFVTACHEWDRANPKPHAYVILSHDMRTALVVEGKTRPSWHRVETQSRGRQRAFYEAPYESCDAYPIPTGGA